MQQTAHIRLGEDGSWWYTHRNLHRYAEAQRAAADRQAVRLSGVPRRQIYYLIIAIEAPFTVLCRIRDTTYSLGMEHLGRHPFPRSLLAIPLLLVALPLLLVEVTLIYPLLIALAKVRVRFYGTHVTATESGLELTDRRTSTVTLLPWSALQLLTYSAQPIESQLQITLTSGERIVGNSLEEPTLQSLFSQSRVPCRYEIEGAEIST